MFLGLDLGTTNVKALVVDETGTVLARGSVAVGIRHAGEGGVEQDIEEIWSAALAAMAEAGRACDLGGVRAVGVSAQGGALQVLDAGYRPLGPVVSWLDARGAPFDGQITQRLGADWFAAHTGHARSGIAVGTMLRLRAQRPDALRPQNRIGFVGDVIVERLCGRPAHDATSLSIALLYNPNLRAADPDLLAELGLGESQLPDLLSAHEPAGGLRAEVAWRTGLAAGIPVSPAVHDQYAAALGAGAVRPGDVMFGAGTAWVLLAAVVPAPGCTRPVVPSAFACTHVVDGLYGQMLSMVNGGSAYAWARQLMGLEYADDAELDAMVAGAPAGSEGVRFLPHLASGGGRLGGLGLDHGRSHVLRAVVEGLAMELARHLRRLSAARLAMCGAAAGSATTPQIVSDATGLPVDCVTEQAVSALGAAVLARALADDTRDLAVLSAAMAPSVRTVTPGPEAALYRAMIDAEDA
jgi:xylulokinase